MADYVPKLGELIAPEENAFRDAIHVAVVPLVAGMTLEPGQHFALDNDNLAWASPPIKAMTIGIVDPFLTQPVQKGQRFWGLMYPNTVQGLRHAWTHPAFANKPPITSDTIIGSTDKGLRPQDDPARGIVQPVVGLLDAVRVEEQKLRDQLQTRLEKQLSDKDKEIELLKAKLTLAEAARRDAESDAQEARCGC